MKTLVKLNKVLYQAGKNEFGPFNLSVSAGERIAILGPSGAGKSTLLKLISGEASASSGAVELFGRDISTWTLPELSSQRAVLPQAHEVAFGLKAELIIELGRVGRRYDPDLKSIVGLSADLARAQHLLHRNFDNLSGGEKARVHIARIFAQLWDVEDALLLVDEPLAALDPGLQFQLLDAILDFSIQRNIGVIAILHDVNHALREFERIWMVKEGCITGDYASSASLLPKLERLYDIRFSSAMTSDGTQMLFPVRNQHRLQEYGT